MTKFERERELVLKAQRGDQDAIMSLYDKYHAIIYKTANRYREKGIAWDDLVAASKEGFFHGLSVHDPTLGWLGGYVKLWCMEFCKKEFLNQRIVRLPREYKKKNPEYVHVMIEANETTLADMYHVSETEIEDTYRHIMQIANDILCERDLMVFMERQNGAKFKEIAPLIERTEQQAGNIYHRAVEKIKQEYKKYEL